MTTLFVVLFALVGLAVVGLAALLVHADHVIKTTPARLAALKFDPDARGQQLTADDTTSRTSARPEPP